MLQDRINLKWVKLKPSYLCSKLIFFPLQIQAGFDPVMFALNAVDQYEDIQNNNMVNPIVVNSKSTLSTVVKTSEEPHHQVRFIS